MPSSWGTLPLSMQEGSSGDQEPRGVGRRPGLGVLGEAGA